MKKDEFKKLFFDYLDEISDPQNRQVYILYIIIINFIYILK